MSFRLARRKPWPLEWYNDEWTFTVCLYKESWNEQKFSQVGFIIYLLILVWSMEAYTNTFPKIRPLNGQFCCISQHMKLVLEEITFKSTLTVMNWLSFFRVFFLRIIPSRSVVSSRFKRFTSVDKKPQLLHTLPSLLDSLSLQGCDCFFTFSIIFSALCRATN